MKVVLLGPLGSGKGTQSNFWLRITILFNLSTGDLLREEVTNKDSPLGKEISEIMNSGDLVPDNIVIQLIVENITIKRKK